MTLRGFLKNDGVYWQWVVAGSYRFSFYLDGNTWIERKEIGSGECDVEDGEGSSRAARCNAKVWIVLIRVGRGRVKHKIRRRGAWRATS